MRCRFRRVVLHFEFIKKSGKHFRKNNKIDTNVNTTTTCYTRSWYRNYYVPVRVLVYVRIHVCIQSNNNSLRDRFGL
jgi:hypothetical protein